MVTYIVALVCRCLGRLFNCLHESIRQKHPDPEFIAKMSGGFYFLRFISPVSLSPKENGLLDVDISAGCRRTMILLSKITQSVSNNIPFTKEVYMKPFNYLVSDKQEDFRSFMLELGDYKDLKDSSPLQLSENVCIFIF